MKQVLVLGGTRFFGIHLVKSLLEQGAGVTLATRGLTPDPFGSRVNRIRVDRTDPDAMKMCIRDRSRPFRPFAFILPPIHLS